MTHKIEVNIETGSYFIHVGSQLFSDLPEMLAKINSNRQVVVISVPPVAGYYLSQLRKSFDDTWDWQVIVVEDGEKSKSGKVLQVLYNKMIESGIERGATILALGGGVVGDLAGFLAATYLRGINLVQIPTSLLAQVDSSIGGKVGINHALGKNLIGAFYQPKLVLSDVSLLATLPAEEFICGMGEVVKYGVIGEPQLFEMLEKNLPEILLNDPKRNLEIVRICAASKARVVSEDEKEQGQRAILNFGHTFGHVFENYFGYGKIKHGQAVLLGMQLAVILAGKLSLIHQPDAQRIIDLIARFNIRVPEFTGDPQDEFMKIMYRDKKVRDGKMTFVLPRQIGRVEMHTVEDDDLIRECFAQIIAGDAT